MRSKIVVGLIFITIGIFLLLANLGLINYNVFHSLVNLWPLLLIVIGINVIARNNKIISYITWLLFFIILIAYGVYTQNSLGVSDLIGIEEVYMERQGSTIYGNLNLDLGASSLNINSTDEDLLSADLSGRRLDYWQEYRNGYENVDIGFESRGFTIGDIQHYEATYDFYLNSEIIWDVEFDLGAVSAYLNFENIPVRSIDLDSGAASLTIVLGDKHDLDLSIDSGASSIDLIIPTGVGLRIEMDSGLTSTNIKDLGLIDTGDYYMTPNFDSADVKINLDIDMGVGKINFEYR